jgi:hypothetical protein
MQAKNYAFSSHKSRKESSLPIVDIGGKTLDFPLFAMLHNWEKFNYVSGTNYALSPSYCVSKISRYFY